MSFHSLKQIPTPNVDSLANSGVILNNYYVSPICSPSRSAIMTGKYPIHTSKYLIQTGKYPTEACKYHIQTSMSFVIQILHLYFTASLSISVNDIDYEKM